MSTNEGLPDPEYTQPPDGFIESWVAYPLGLEREADQEGFAQQLEVLSERYGPENVMPGLVEIEGVVYPGIKVFKPDDPTDRAISNAWGEIFFAD